MSETNNDNCCNNATKVLGQYDYIIIGAGASSMGLLLGLLKPYIELNIEPPFTIALIERGIKENDISTYQLTNWFNSSHIKNQSNHIYVGNILHHNNDRIDVRRCIDIPIGKGLGGTTNINAGIILPPSNDDFIQWPNIIKDNIMNATRVILNTMNDNNCLDYNIHNNNNEDLVFELKYPSFYSHVPYSSGLSNDNTSESSPHHLNSNNNNNKSEHTTNRVRKNFYVSLLKPLLDNNPIILQKYLSIYTNYHVERLLFDHNKCCIGIEMYCNVTGRMYHVYANKEVIVSAGCIETPAILLSSGIGNNNNKKQQQDPHQHTNQQYNSVRSSFIINNNNNDYNGNVGGKLRDHILLVRVYWNFGKKQYKDIHRNNINSGGVRAIHNLEIHDNNNDSYYRSQAILMDSSSFLDSIPHMLANTIRIDLPLSNDNNKSLYNIMIQQVNWFLNLLYHIIKSGLYILIMYTPIRVIIRNYISVVLVSVMNPKSTGNVTINSKENNNDNNSIENKISRRSDYDININLSYFNKNTTDLIAIVEAWKASEASYPDIGVEIFPSYLIRNLWNYHINMERFTIFARCFVMSFFHWMGACAMQQQKQPNTNNTNDKNDDIDIDNNDWVVDENLYVRNYTNLRICDASIFPTTISSPPSLTCAAIGYLYGNQMSTTMMNEKQTRQKMKKAKNSMNE